MITAYRHFAHVYSSEVNGAGNPEILIFTEDKGAGLGRIAQFPLTADITNPDALVALLNLDGWRVISQAVQVEFGYWVAEVEDADATPQSSMVWVVHRVDQLDGIYLFASEFRARQYASFYGDSAVVSRERVMNDSAAGQFIIDSADDEVSGTVLLPREDSTP